MSDLMSDSAVKPDGILNTFPSMKPIEVVNSLKQLRRSNLPKHPEKIGQYEIVRICGRGGMGIVYEGFDQKLKRKVAIKVLHNKFDLDMIQRFENEGEAVAQVQHPNIVQIYDTGWDNENPYVVLEFVTGENLHEIICTKPQSKDDILKILIPLADAVSNAHKQGILHRDIKPANILISNTGVLKLTDFGVAKLKRFGEETKYSLTRNGEIVGTPHYMSPEQAIGEEVTAATDIYSIGAILYEMLTGRPPFNHADVYEIMHMALTHQPISPRILQPNVPLDLETICLKCLEKNPARRYSSVDELKSDLLRFQSGQPILAKPLSWNRKIWHSIKQRPVLSASVTSIFVAGIIGIYAFLWQFSQTKKALDVANHNSKLANENAMLAEKESKLARQQLEESKWNLYCNSLMNANLKIEQSNIDAANKTLEEASTEYRHFEWNEINTRINNSHWRRIFINDVVSETPLWPTRMEMNPSGTKIALLLHDPYMHQGNSLQNIRLIIYDAINGNVEYIGDREKQIKAKDITWIDDQNIALLEHRFRYHVLNYKTKKTEVKEIGKGLFLYHHFHYHLNEDTKFTNTSFRFDDGNCRIYNRKMECIFTIDLSFLEKKFKTNVTRLTLSPDQDKLLIELNNTDTERINVCYNIKKDKIVWMCEQLIGYKFSNDGKQLLVSTESNHKAKNQGFWNCHDQKYSVPEQVDNSFSNTYIFDTTSWKINSIQNGNTIRSANFILSPDNIHYVQWNNGTLGVGSNNQFQVKNFKYNNITTLIGHTGQYRSMQFSPNGMYIATASDDKTIRIWNTYTGENIQTINNHLHSVRNLLFSKDGTLLYSAGADGNVYCWDLTKEENKNGIAKPIINSVLPYSYMDLAFNKNNEIVSLSSFDKKIRTYQPGSSLILSEVNVDDLPVRNAKEIIDYVFNSDARFLAGRSEANNNINVWDCNAGQVIQSFETKISKDQLYSVAISKNGEFVSVFAFQRRNTESRKWFYCWEVKTGRLCFEKEIAGKGLSVAFSDDASEIAIGYYRHSDSEEESPVVQVYNLKGEVLRSYQYDQAAFYVPVISYMPQSKRIVFLNWSNQGDMKDSLCIAEPGSNTISRKCIIDSGLTSITFTNDSKRIAVTGYQDEISIIDTDRWTEVVSYKMKTGRVNDEAFPTRVRFSHDSQTLACTNYRSQIVVWRNQPTKNRDQYIYRFHLENAKNAIRQKDDFAINAELNCLKMLNPPSKLIELEYLGLLEKVQKSRIQLNHSSLATTEK